MSDAKVAESGGRGVMQLVVVAVVVVVLVLGAVGGAGFWLMKSGRLPMPGAAVVAPAPVVAKVEPPKTKLVLLDPLLVNLADPGGAGYLRVVMAVSVEEPAPGKDEKPKEEKPPEKGKVAVNEVDVKMRDAALDVLGKQSSEHLLSADGKEALKSELKAALTAHVPGVKVDEILFTEFLVQR